MAVTVRKADSRKIDDKILADKQHKTALGIDMSTWITASLLPGTIINCNDLRSYVGSISCHKQLAGCS